MVIAREDIGGPKPGGFAVDEQRSLEADGHRRDANRGFRIFLIRLLGLLDGECFLNDNRAVTGPLEGPEHLRLKSTTPDVDPERPAGHDKLCPALVITAHPLGTG